MLQTKLLKPAKIFRVHFFYL